MKKKLKILKTIFNGSEVLKFEHIVFSTNYFKGLETSHTPSWAPEELFMNAGSIP